jgi:hypothetical protein
LKDVDVVVNEFPSFSNSRPKLRTVLARFLIGEASDVPASIERRWLIACEFGAGEISIAMGERIALLVVKVVAKGDTCGE